MALIHILNALIQMFSGIQQLVKTWYNYTMIRVVLGIIMFSERSWMLYDSNYVKYKSW